MFRSLICRLFGHRWFIYPSLDYQDCTRCGAVGPHPLETVH